MTEHILRDPVTKDEARKFIEKARVELRQLRLNKQNLEAEINNLENSRFNSLDKLNKANANLSELFVKLREINTKIIGASKELTLIKNKIKAEIALLDTKKDALLAIGNKNEQYAEDNKKAAELLRKANLDLKAREQDLIIGRQALNKDKAALEADRIDLRNKYDLLAQDKAALAKETDNLNIEKQKIASNLKKSNDIKAVIENELLETQKNSEEVKVQLRVRDQLNQDLLNQEKEVGNKIAALNKQIEQNRQLEARLLKKIQEQEAFDKEIRLKALRGEKLIRDKNIEKEIEELEKELKK